MYLPGLNNVRTNKEITDVFYGYSARLRAGAGEFAATRNLTADHFPVMSERDKRTHIRNIEKANGMYASDGIVWCDGTDLYFNGRKVEDLTLTDTEKTFVRMGAWLVIFPDKVMYNTHDGSVKMMENTYTSTGTVSFIPCTADGTDLTYNTGPTEPQNPSDGDYWLKDGKELYRYIATMHTWMPIPTAYIKVSEIIDSQENEEFAKGFAENDAVDISIGCPEGDPLERFNGNWIIYGKKEDDDSCFIVAGITSAESVGYTVTISRTVPDMDYVCENENRLWGCSSKKHEIYACSLGDPTNWNAFQGFADSSYSATIGSAGDFTGCISHRGYVLFFKEDCIHRVYGNQPGNFQLMDINCRGVEKGSERSLCIINEVLYYKARDCVCAFDGSISGSISSALGNAVYHDAIAGSCRNTYMVSMCDSGGIRHTFTYDTDRNIWMHEDTEEIIAFAKNEGALYYMTPGEIRLVQEEHGTQLLFPHMDLLIRTGEGEVYEEIVPGMAEDDEYIIYPGSPPVGAVEKDVEWSAETHDIGMEYTGAKYVSKIVLRLTCEKEFKMDVMYDSDGIWENVLSIGGTGKRSVTVPVRLRRCDHCRLRIYGKGRVKLYSLAKTIEQGLEA